MSLCFVGYRDQVEAESEANISVAPFIERRPFYLSYAPAARPRRCLQGKSCAEDGARSNLSKLCYK